MVVSFLPADAFACVPAPDASTHSALYLLAGASRDPRVSDASRNGRSGFQPRASTCSIRRARSSPYP